MYTAGVMDRYEYIVNLSRDFITLINRQYVYEIVNDTYCREIGRDRNDILGHRVEEVWGTERFAGGIRCHLDQCFAGQEVHYIDSFTFGAFEKTMHVSYYPYGEAGEITHALVFSHDITRLGEIESKLTEYEFRDPVTGLFNRRSLDIILDKEIEKARRSSSENLRGVMFVRLTNLGEITRVHGHSMGDLLLENTGLRLRKVLRRSDYVFRFEGAELTILLAGVARNTDVAGVAEKIHQAVTLPYRYAETDLYVGCAVGVSVYPDDGQDRDAVIRSASSALQEARRRGEPFVLFNRELHLRAVERLHLHADLARALEAEELALAYQPIVDREGRIVGAEALARWQHPERGAIAPLQFIPLAEETGLIARLGRWALFTACRDAARWRRRFPVYVSVNLSVREFEDPQLPETLQAALQAAGLEGPAGLKLEITESGCMRDPSGAAERIQRIQAQGIEVLIDDFGTGHSSLGYLKQLPAGTLKLDRMFLENLEQPGEREFLERIIAAVKSRGKTVLLEGVSTPGQAELLRRLPVDLMQGFHFGRPVPAARLEALLQAGRLPAEN